MKKTLLVLSLLGILGACSSNDNRNDRSNTNSNCQEDSDWQITGRVKAALMGDGGISASGRMVSVETNNGVVTLTGNVPTNDEYRYIERKVNGVKGVRKVDNQMTVNP